jgi:hypothetical protein
MKTFTLAFLAIWASFALTFAQPVPPKGKISGQILDAAKQPAIAATVILVKAKDSATVKTSLANVQGKFVFDHIATGEYRVWVTLVGFQKHRSEIIKINEATPVELAPITLKAGGTNLKEVAITADKQLVEQKIDRTVVNVGASISNTGANALEVLEKAPGVIVDESGTITFKGKTGVLILIDDKPTYLAGDNLVAYLKSLPASMLDQIELMPNPPAKYDAAGNAGVINIKTKKSKARGFNGSVAASVSKAVYYRTNESLNLNYHTGKVNLFANTGFTLQTYYRRLDVGRHYFNNNGAPTSSYTEVAFFHNTNYIPNLRMGMDYYVSPKTTLGVVLTGSQTIGTNLNPVNSVLRNGAGQLDSTIVADNSTHNLFRNGGVNFNYSHQFDSLGKALTFDVDYVRYNSRPTQNFSNGSYNSAGVLSSTQHIIDNLPAYINIYAAKTDYTQPLPGKGKLSAGLKTSYVNTDNAANYFNVIGNATTVDNNNTNHFLYRENINAGYISFNQEYKRLSIQAGLRGEQTNVNGHQLGNAASADSAFAQHYFNLFPTAYLLYKLDSAGKHTLNLSYGRRIDRPNYQNLNPFVTILDKYSQFTGNPFLKPQFASEYELTYAYKGIFSFGVEYHLITDYQVEYDYQKGDIFVATSVNIGRRPYWNAHASLNLNPVKWWSFNFYTEVVNTVYKGQVGSIFVNNKTTYFYYNYNSQINLSHSWSAELSMFYITPTSDSQFSHIAREQVNAGLQKKVLNNKGAIKIGIRDLFRGNYSAGNINNVPNAIITYHNDNGNRTATLGFTYNFGKAGNTPKKRAVGSADTEQGRVGN